jgi:hypothetical protein
VSFELLYITGYHCLHQSVAWPGLNGSIVGNIVIKCKTNG